MATQSENQEGATPQRTTGAEIAASVLAQFPPAPAGLEDVTDQDIFDLAQADPMFRSGAHPGMYWPDRLFQRDFFAHAQKVAADTGTHRDAIALEVLRRAVTVLRISVRGWSTGKPLHLAISAVMCAISGGGKSTAFGVAKKAAPFPDLPGEDCPRTQEWVDPEPDLKILERGLGSGEGILSRLVVQKPTKADAQEDGAPPHVLVRRATRYHVTDPEGSTLLNLRDRRGATVEQMLLKCSFGEQLDTANSEENGRDRVVEAGTYRVTTGFGGQPMVLDALYSDTSKGFPQRQLLVMANGPLDDDFSVEDAKARLNALNSGAATDGRPRVLLAGVQSEDREYFSELLTWLEQLEDVTVRSHPVAEEAAQLMIDLGKTDQVAAADHHRPAITMVLACALALVDRRTEMSEEDWVLACDIWQTHTHVRDHMIGLAGIARRVQEAKLAESRARSAAMSARAVAASQLEKPIVISTASSVTKLIDKRDGKPVTKKQLREAVLSPKRRADWDAQRGEDQRNLIDAVLDYLKRTGEVQEAPGDRSLVYTR